MTTKLSPHLVPLTQWISLLALLHTTSLPATILDEVVSNQVLTMQGSPYYAVTNVKLSNVTLEPGTTILVTGPYELTATGIFHAVGTANFPIRIKPATNGTPWKGMVITNANVSSRMEFCWLEGSDTGGLRVFGTPLVLRSCVIANNSAPAQGGGIYTDGPLTLEHCVVTNNTVSGAIGKGGGIASQGNSLRCIRSIISRNRIETSSSFRCTSFGGGVYCEGSVELLDGSQIVGNRAAAYGGDIVTECSAQGAGVWSGADVFGTNVLIAGNEALADGANHPPASFGGGVWCAGPVILLRSEVRDNAAINTRTGASRAGGIRGYSISAFSTVFSGNTTTANYDYLSEGGAIYSISLVTLGNCLLAQNRNDGLTPFQSGSAVWGGDTGSVIENCTIADNTQSRGTRLGAFNGFRGAISNSIIHGNGGAFFNGSPSSVGFSLVESADPLFADRINYFLSTNSPAVDGGNPDPVFNDAGPHALGTLRNDMGVYGGPGALPALGYTPPLFIISQPASQIVNVGSTVTFNISVVGGRDPIEYQWRFNGVGIVGQTNSSLTLSNITLSRAGTYSVTVNSLDEGLISTDATLSVTQLKMYAGLTISGIIGANYRIDYTTNFQFNGWTVLTNVTLPSSPYLFIDVESADSFGRVYRFVLLQ